MVGDKIKSGEIFFEPLNTIFCSGNSNPNPNPNISILIIGNLAHSYLKISFQQLIFLSIEKSCKIYKVMCLYPSNVP